jgi:hypothetical protein
VNVFWLAMIRVAVGLALLLEVALGDGVRVFGTLVGLWLVVSSVGFIVSLYRHEEEARGK